MNERILNLSGVPLALLLSATQLLAFSDRFLITLVAPAIKRDFDLSDAQLGLLQGSAFAAVYVLSTLAAGRFVDRGHCRSLLLLSVSLWSGATLAMGFVDSFGGLLVARALLGLGQGAIAPAALSLLSYRLPRKRLGRAVSWFTASGTLGRSLALLGGGAVLSWLMAGGDRMPTAIDSGRPWQTLFVLACLPNLLLIPGLWWIVERPGAPRRRTAPAVGWLWRHRTTYGPHFASAAAAVLIGQTLATWAPTFYMRAFVMAPVEAGFSLGILVVVAAPLGNLLGGQWIDRASAGARRRIASRLIAVGLAVAIPAMIAMTLIGNLAVSLAAFAVAVAALGVTSPGALAGLQILTPRRLRGRVSAYFIASVTLVALGVGPPLVGLVNDRMDTSADIGWAMILVFVPVASIGITMALMTGVARPHGGPRRPAFEGRTGRRRGERLASDRGRSRA